MFLVYQFVSRLSRLTRTNMPITRSATRASTTASSVPKVAANAPKRKVATAASYKAPRKKRRANEEPEAPVENHGSPPSAPTLPVIPFAASPPVIVPAVLSFSFEDAKEHLIEADERFKDVFERMKCTPFQELDQMEPFR
jgi:DNA-3-methyladenine glycosylase II